MPLDLRDLNQDALISLFTLDLTPIGETQVVRFCNWSDTEGLNVSFDGDEYQAYPIQAEGFELNTTGQIPTPTLMVSNIFRDITALSLSYDDLVGAKVIRLRTFVKHLDGGTSPNTTKFLSPDIFYVERKTAENKLSVTFELSALLDLGDFELPSRPIISNLCVWQYRSGECGYAGGAVADEFDSATSDINRDKCGKRVKSCKLRFGNNGNLPFGGFPAVDASRGE